MSKPINMLDRASDNWWKNFRTKEEVALDALWEIHNEGHDGGECKPNCPYYESPESVA